MKSRITQNSGGTAANRGRFQKGNPYRLPPELARAILEENFQDIKKAFAKLLKRGNLAAFALLAERAYGKVPQPVVVTVRGTRLQRLTAEGGHEKHAR